MFIAPERMAPTISRRNPKEFAAALIFFTCLWTGSWIAAQERAATANFLGRTICSIEIDSDPPIDADRYSSAIGIKAGDRITRSAVKKAIQALHDTGRFSHISVHAEMVNQGVALRFLLRLNYYFSRFFIEGKLDLEGRLPWEVISLPVGERYTDEDLEAARQEVIGYLKSRGFYHPEVAARISRDEAKRQVDTTFMVQTGALATIGSITIAGVPAAEREAVRKEFRFKAGEEYQRRRLEERMDALKRFFVERGYLAAVAHLGEHYETADNTVALELQISNFGEVRVSVEGYKIRQEQLQQMLPVLAGEGLEPAVLEEGLRYLQDYMENQGYPESELRIEEEKESGGVLNLRYVIDPGRKVTVRDVLFRGNRAISDGELLSTIRIQPARFLQKSVYSVSKLDADVAALQALYRASGYLEAVIIPLVVPHEDMTSLTITFECAEGERSRTGQIAFRGNETIDDSALGDLIGLSPGGYYSPYLAERDRQIIIDAYNDMGFLQPRVTYRLGDPDRNGGYPIEFEIVEGVQAVIDDIVIVGNDHTKESAIRRRFTFDAGEPLNLGSLIETQQALYDMGTFDFVRVAPQNPESRAPYQNVVVRVEEAQQFSLRYSLGYEQRAKVRGMLELHNLRIPGTQRRADLRFRLSSIERGAILSFRQSQISFLPVNSYFTLSVREKEEVSFDAFRVNLAYQYSRPIGDHSWGQFRYRFRNVRVSNLDAASEIGREDQPRNLSTFSAVYINDTRDNFMDPQRGFFSSTDLSLTTKLLGSNNYVSLYTQNSYHRALPASLLAALGMRFGLALPYGGDDEIPISERYYAGGAYSLRGFETDLAGPLDPETDKPVGGNALLIGNLEIRYPLLRMIKIAGFYDVGNVFRTFRKISTNNISHTLGIGLRVRTPLGPVRVDYGYNMNLPAELRDRGFGAGQFFVTIGPPF
jgi:outer membrane protein insertion porin family